MSTEVIVALVGLLGVIFSGAATVIAARIATSVAKTEKETMKRAEQRAEESKLSMDLMSAACALSVVCAKKLTNQHTNGDVEEAMEAAIAAQSAYRDFCSKQVAKELSRF